MILALARYIILPALLLVFALGLAYFLYSNSFSLYLQVGNAFFIAVSSYGLTQNSIRQLRFSKGHEIIVEGIAFYLEPENPQMVFGASPSTTTTSNRIELVVSEVQRILPDFMSQHCDLRYHFQTRQLAIRLIDDYESVRTKIKHEQTIEIN